ncbi:MAG TPA: hypothetical protein VJ831_08005, partial [Jatrophihabitantaceae bacterium]|nr:hypothetical protein [Jatrophihabitantaceae bacterium]
MLSRYRALRLHGATRLARRSAELVRGIDIGVAGVALAMFCAAAAFALVSAPLGTPDEVAHIDYAIQVWHGHLPVFEQGVSWHPPVNRPPVQWEAQHPPLYYLILAPFVGPLASHWLVTTIVARLISAVIAAGAVLAIAWAASLVAQRRRKAWAIAASAVVAPVAIFVRVGGSAYNDNLTVLLTALGLGIGFLCIRRGATRQRVGAAAVVCALGMLARAEFGATLVLVSAALGAAVLLADDAPGRRLSLLPRAALVAAIPVVAAFVASGWFYIRNKRITGSFTGGHPDWAQEHLRGFRRKSLDEVLHNTRFWKSQYELLREYRIGDSTAEHLLITGATVLTVVAVLASMPRWRRLVDARQLVIIGLLAGLAFLTLASEILYVRGGGGLNARYVLPAMLPVGCFLAAGIVALPRLLRALALAGYLAGAWWIFVSWIVDRHGDTAALRGTSLWHGRTLDHASW